MSHQNIDNQQNIEQPTVVPEVAVPAGVDKDNVDSFGKFKTAQELKSAYEKLEQEFTRKSQKLKELEKALSEKKENDRWTEKVKELHAKYPCSQSLGEEITAYIKENKGLMERENCLENALLHVLSEKFEANSTAWNTPKDATQKTSKNVENVREYVEKRENMPVVLDGGEMTVAPRGRILTVKDAGKLATERLKKYKQ